MVRIDMGIPKDMDELARFEPDYLSDHHRQERVGGDIERNPEESIGGSLVHLTGKLPVRDIELEHHMTWREEHTVGLYRIIGHDEHSAGVRILLQGLDDILHLIHSFVVEIAPLETVDRTEIPMGSGKCFVRFDPRDEIRLREFPSLLHIGFIRPFVPDMHIVIHEILDIGFPPKEPEKLMDDPLQKNFLGREEREPFLKVESHLATENASRSGSGPIALIVSFVHDLPQEIEILLFAMRHKSYTNDYYLKWGL